MRDYVRNIVDITVNDIADTTMNTFLREGPMPMDPSLGHFEDVSEMVQGLYGWTADEASQWLRARARSSTLPLPSSKLLQSYFGDSGALKALDVFMENEERAHERLRSR